MILTDTEADLGDQAATEAIESLRKAVIEHLGTDLPHAAIHCYSDPIFGYHGSMLSDAGAGSSAGWDPQDDTVLPDGAVFGAAVAAICPIGDVTASFYVYADGTVTWHRPRS
jgi:hypothetical protein